jgi:uncharacterized protein (DUF1778 family)
VKHNRRSEKRKRSCLVALRLLPEEFKLLHACAVANGLPLSRFIREAALDLAREQAVEDADLLVTGENQRSGLSVMRWHHVLLCRPTRAGMLAFEELHQFALRIGLRRSYFQDPRHGPNDPGRPHYDVTAPARARAVAAGAVEVDIREVREINARRRAAAADRGEDQ